MDLPTDVRVRAPGMRPVIATVEQAVDMIDRQLPVELARLPRWTFARALLLEAARTGKSRDLNTALRQLRQALGTRNGCTRRNERARLIRRLRDAEVTKKSSVPGSRRRSLHDCVRVTPAAPAPAA